MPIAATLRFRVTTNRGHTVQTFQPLELALEAAESLGLKLRHRQARPADLEPATKVAA
jgi:hypothetical protein